jgi:hypothetical protein
LLLGYSTTWTAVIFPPETVIWTWTGPHRVLAAVPVTVVVPVLDEPVLALDDDGAAAVPEDDDVPVTGASAEVSPPAVPPAAAALEDVDVW